MKKIIAIGLLTTMVSLTSMNISEATSNLENEYKEITKGYDSEDIIVENGLSIKKDEELDLSEYPGWKMSNEDTVTIDEKGVVTPISNGTVYLSNEINGKLCVIEIYVSDKDVNKATLKNQTVNRDYYKVFIDAGHGGHQPGNVSFGYEEEAINLNIAKLVEQKLNDKDIKIEVKMSRTADTYVALSDRANMANAYGADVFVSIHNNAFTTSSVNGIETYHHGSQPSYGPLANEVQTNAINATGANNRGVKTADFVVLRETNMPAILFEGGFMTNKAEMDKLATPQYQDKLATAIANGVETYLVENIKLTENPEFIPPYVPSTQSLTRDIYKYDAGSGNYLTYINGRGYSQFSYLNRSGNYAFVPSSWISAAGLQVKMPTSNNGYIMQITNPYIKMVDEANSLLNNAKAGRISSEEIQSEIYKIERNLSEETASVTAKSSPNKTLTKDIYKYDAGKGNYLTYINGRGYSQFSYLNRSGNYAFVPSSWIKAAGVNMTMPTSSNGYKTTIDNAHMKNYNDIVLELNNYL